MRVTALVFTVAAFSAGSASAQEWEQYVSTRDGFKVDFPGQPTITETTWKSEYDYTLPARVYSADKGKEHYSITVVDYNGIQKMGLGVLERPQFCGPHRSCGRGDQRV